MFDAMVEKISVMNFKLMFIYFALSFFGVLVIFSADYNTALGQVNNGFYLKQMVFVAMGIVLFFIFSFINYRTWVHFSLYVYILGVVLLVFVLNFSPPINGAKSWINLGFFSLQPSELMKVATILLMATMFVNYDGRLLGIVGVAKYSIPVVVSIVLISLQPDQGTALVYLIMFGLLILTVGVRLYVLIGAGILTVVSLPVVWAILKPYQRERILVIIDPTRDPFNAGYQVIQSKIAIGSGGIPGKGFLEGTQSNLNFIPYPHNDFIFTITAEEFGFVGGVVVILMLLALMYIVFTSAYAVREMPAKIITISTATLLFTQFIINTYMVVGLIPVIGITLPFLSYGGSSYLTFAILLGIVHSIHISRRLQV